ncbi:response regulator transcription factor [Poseidonocella sp. HB161398]|uniref:response regulator transcription factor n=1 Tax=Poseidonocella sp. HB161398 TaxID=2320855 RepID=UPI001485FFC3|nr:response regulator [Poseidonocella sp. HB161398]
MSQLQIAVIEDDALVRSATGSLLRSLGHRVALYPTVEDFLAAGAPAADCVLSDQRMAGRTGLDLLELFAAQGETVPFILMTAFRTPGLDARARQLGALSVLEKPFDESALIGLLGGLAAG